MFCSTTKAMLCMRCFSEASLETRLHCLDLDLAYDQGKKKLKRALKVNKYISKSFKMHLVCLQFIQQDLSLRDRDVQLRISLFSYYFPVYAGPTDAKV